MRPAAASHRQQRGRRVRQPRSRFRSAFRGPNWSPSSAHEVLRRRRPRLQTPSYLHRHWWVPRRSAVPAQLVQQHRRQARGTASPAHTAERVPVLVQVVAPVAAAVVVMVVAHSQQRPHSRVPSVVRFPRQQVEASCTVATNFASPASPAGPRSTTCTWPAAVARACSPCTDPCCAALSIHRCPTCRKGFSVVSTVEEDGATQDHEVDMALCAICLQRCGVPGKAHLACDHTFCFECIMSWARIHNVYVGKPSLAWVVPVCWHSRCCAGCCLPINQVSVVQAGIHGDHASGGHTRCAHACAHACKWR